MGRIRSIKPELPQSETIGRLSRDARLCFLMLFTVVDDSGRARAASRLLKGLLFPYDDDAAELIDSWLDELAKAKLIRRYTVEGSQYLEITNWLEHQKIDKPTKSRLPAFVAGSDKPREASTTDMDMDLGSGPVSRIVSADERQAAASPEVKPATDKPKSKSKAPKPTAAPKEPKPDTRGTRMTVDRKLSEKNLEHAKAEGLSEVESAKHWVEFRNYWSARPGKDGLKLDWDATWHNRCIQIAERLGRERPRQVDSVADVAPAKSFSIQRWEKILNIYGTSNSWHATWGPPPGEIGCLVPKELLPEDEPQVDELPLGE